MRAIPIEPKQTKASRNPGNHKAITKFQSLREPQQLEHSRALLYISFRDRRSTLIAPRPERPGAASAAAGK